jgi:predicted transport protein
MKPAPTNGPVIPVRRTEESSPRKPMWRCPVCRREFANRNQSHACGTHDLEAHFQGKPAGIRGLYDQFVAQVRRCGPVTILPEKTRIAFQVRMSFAAVQVQRSKITGHLVLAERHERPCFARVDYISRSNHVHHFTIAKAEDLNEELRGFIQQAYRVGEQKHLRNHP